VRIEEAIEVFGQGFTFTRGFTHPYLFERVAPLWVMRDAPRKRPEYRNEEWLVYRTPAEEAERVIQANRRQRYAVCVFLEGDETHEHVKIEFKAIGYRFHGVETLFDHSLNQIPEFKCSYSTKRVVEMADAEKLKEAAGSWQVRPQDLADPNSRLRQYIACDGETAVGWVRSIRCGDSGWCSNMFVKADYRRQGIGKALMSRMLLDDRASGQTSAVLLASHSGAMLYPKVGYEKLGTLAIFTRKKS